jgi:hypothetical protein
MRNNQTNMEPQYIVRLDDACHTNDLKIWDYVEKRLVDLKIQPIVGVIPDSKDPDLNRGTFDPHFWDRVQRWEKNGWHIALHGFNHQYISKNKGLVPLNSYSEFAGVPIDVQRQKIRQGYQLFLQNGIKPTIWMAPAHSFDKNTLKVLREETAIRIITEGLAYYPYTKHGFLWLPQQLWNFSLLSKGVWTTCFHIETAKLDWIDYQLMFIEKNRSLFMFDFAKMVETYGKRKIDIWDLKYKYKFFCRKFYDNQRLNNEAFRFIIKRLKKNR